MCAVAVFLPAFAQTASAYTPTLSQSGKHVRWRQGFKLNMAGNPENASDVRSHDFFSAMVRGLQRWGSASGGGVRFDYWQGTDKRIYEANSSYNGLSSVYFASNLRGEGAISPNVLGLTQVWYNTETGEILEADIVLNDRDFRFTTNPTDTSGPGSGSTSFERGKSQVFIENVITHELGHAFGLSHTGAQQSTMLYMESPEQAYLGCDELTGIRALYPAEGSGERGSISGGVVSSAGKPVFGAHVLAISRRRGTVLATSLTDRSGRFRIQALEPGEYFLLAEPFYAGPQALPAYFSQIGEGICDAPSSFSRTFLAEPSASGSSGTSALQRILVRPGPASEAVAPTIRVECHPIDAPANPLSSADDGSASLIYSGSGSGLGAISRVLPGSGEYHRLDGVSGRLELHALSYSLYSPVRVKMTLLDENGVPVPTETRDPIYEGHSGFISFDSMMVAEALPRGRYYLHLSSSALSPMQYPGGRLPLDAAPFVLISGSLNEPPPSLSMSIPNNARCAQDENFGPYVSPPGDPPRNALQEDSDRVGFCGSIRVAEGGGGGRGGAGPSAAAIIGWFTPYLLALVILRMLRRSGRQRTVDMGCA